MDEISEDYVESFTSVLGCLCHREPPRSLILEWIRENNNNLQVWVLNNCKLEWAQGIVIIEATMSIAGNIQEHLNPMNRKQRIG